MSEKFSYDNNQSYSKYKSRFPKECLRLGKPHNEQNERNSLTWCARENFVHLPNSIFLLAQFCHFFFSPS